MKVPALFFTMLMALFAPALAQAGAPSDLVGPGALAALHQSITGQAASSSFAAYVITPVGDDLYIGTSSSAPGGANGAMLAQWSGGVLTPRYSFAEQGIVDLDLQDNMLYSAGYDPLDDWSRGNLYIYDIAAAQMTKQRTLPNVIHGYGVWGDASGIYVAARRTDDGAVLHSVDGGLTWTTVGSPADAYDVLRTNNLLYATRNGKGGCVLQAYDGAAWQDVYRGVACFPRLYAANGKPLALTRRGTALYTGGRKAVPFAGFTVSAWNWLAITPSGYYVITTDGRVMVSSDLWTWREFSNLGVSLASIVYYPSHNSLVVAEQGGNARLVELILP